MLNAARLFVDGQLVDRKRMWYGEKELSTTAQNGKVILVAVDSGWVW